MKGRRPGSLQVSQKGSSGDSVGHRGEAAGVFRPWGCVVPGTSGALSVQAKQALLPEGSQRRQGLAIGRESPPGALVHKNDHDYRRHGKSPES